MSDELENILAVLPQTQCEECGYQGCRPYAEAIVSGEDIDLCAPGGEAVFHKLAAITKREGDLDLVKSRYQRPRLAKIDLEVCIGCTKCIKPCPTQAIVGAKKSNHFVIAADCTGCGLCVKYCPVDCITMEDDLLSYQGALSLADEYRALNEEKIAQQTQPSLQKKSSEQLKLSLQDILGESSE